MQCKLAVEFWTQKQSLVVSSFLILQKAKKELDEKEVTRESNNSLITFPTASSFSVFSHIRHFVLQQQLCDRYNLRIKESGDHDSDDEYEEEEKEQESKQKLPEVCKSIYLFHLLSVFLRVC